MGVASYDAEGQFLAGRGGDVSAPDLVKRRAAFDLPGFERCRGGLGGLVRRELLHLDLGESVVVLHLKVNLGPRARWQDARFGRFYDLDFRGFVGLDRYGDFLGDGDGIALLCFECERCSRR